MYPNHSVQTGGPSSLDLQRFKDDLALAASDTQLNLDAYAAALDGKNIIVVKVYHT